MFIYVFIHIYIYTYIIDDQQCIYIYIYIHCDNLPQAWLVQDWTPCQTIANLCRRLCPLDLCDTGQAAGRPGDCIGFIGFHWLAQFVVAFGLVGSAGAVHFAH